MAYSRLIRRYLVASDVLHMCEVSDARGSYLLNASLLSFMGPDMA